MLQQNLFKKDLVQIIKWSISHALENSGEILAQHGIFPTTCSVNICTKTSVTECKMYTKSIRMSALGDKSNVWKLESGWKHKQLPQQKRGR